MDRPWNILYHLTLVGASTYGLMSMSLRSKRFALAALVLYYANGWFGLLDELIPENEAITKADYFAYKIAAISGVNLFAAEVCISSDVDTVLPYLLLVPSALDLFMNYVVRIRWNSITKVTQIFSVSLLYNFAFRDKRPILFVPGTAFLFAMLSPIFVDIPGYNTVAVFFTVWFLEGKDFEDFGF